MSLTLVSVSLTVDPGFTLNRTTSYCRPITAFMEIEFGVLRSVLQFNEIIDGKATNKKNSLLQPNNREFRNSIIFILGDSVPIS